MSMLLTRRGFLASSGAAAGALALGARAFAGADKLRLATVGCGGMEIGRASCRERV